MIALILFGVLFLLITVGVPVGFALGGATILCMALFTNLDLSLVASYAVTGIDSLPMMAIPFFMLSGVIMSVGGLARRLIDVAASVVGWMTGGLGAVVSLSSMFFGAISGSSMATVSCIGSIMVPEMKKKGYDMGYSAVFTACAGTIGAVIPPSIPLVVFGVCTSTSVGDLFVGGILPGILIGLGLIVSNFIVCKKREATAAWNAKAEGKFSARFGRPSGHCLRQSSFWAEFMGAILHQRRLLWLRWSIPQLLPC